MISHVAIGRFLLGIVSRMGIIFVNSDPRLTFHPWPHPGPTAFLKLSSEPFHELGSIRDNRICHRVGGGELLKGCLLQEDFFRSKPPYLTTWRLLVTEKTPDTVLA